MVRIIIFVAIFISFSINFISADSETNIQGNFIFTEKNNNYVSQIVNAESEGYYLVGKIAGRGKDTFNLLLSKIDNRGSVEWQKIYGGMDAEIGCALAAVEKGALVAGHIENGISAEKNMWLVKIDKQGKIIWEKSYGGKNNESAQALVVNHDNSFLVAGYTSSYGAGADDFWIIKLDSDGNILWAKTYGGPDNERALQAINADNGNFIIGGITSSFGAGLNDILVLKIDSKGELVWQKAFGKSGVDYLYGLITTKKDGYALVGSSGTGEQNCSALVMLLDSEGSIIMEKLYKKGDNDSFRSIVQTEDQNFIVAGSTETRGKTALWIIKIDNKGNIIWEKLYNSSNNNTPCAIISDISGGYFVFGNSMSPDNQENIWLFKIDSQGNILSGK